MHRIIRQHLCANTILVTEWYGLRKRIPTENGAFILTVSVFKSVNQNMYVQGVFCDLANAVDCVNHEYCQLIYISVEYGEYLKIGSGPV